MKIRDFLKLLNPKARVTISGVYAAEMTVWECDGWLARHPEFADVYTNQYSHCSANNGIRMHTNLIATSGRFAGRLVFDITLPEETP